MKSASVFLDKLQVDVEYEYTPAYRSISRFEPDTHAYVEVFSVKVHGVDLIEHLKPTSVIELEDQIMSVLT